MEAHHALHVFDMDGTLLTGSASLELSRRAGSLDVVEDMEERWARGEIGHVEFYEMLLPLWADLTEADVRATFDDSPWLDGVGEVFRDIRDRGEHAIVISLSPQFFVDLLLDLGLGAGHGARVHPRSPLDPADVLTPQAKVEIVDRTAQRHGIAGDRIVAYGDSASDVPLFRRLPKTVAVNGSPAVRGLARCHYDGGDLRGAYRLGRELLDGTAPVAEVGLDGLGYGR